VAVRPLYVDFAVSEDQPLVFIKAVKLLSVQGRLIQELIPVRVIDLGIVPFVHGVTPPDSHISHLGPG
jgi:hypothetical protein